MGESKLGRGRGVRDERDKVELECPSKEFVFHSVPVCI